MKIFKAMSKALAASFLLGAAGVSQATPLNIGGVKVPVGAHFEVASVYENNVTQVNDVLSGYGEITQINGSADFCSAGLGTCELTYVFGGFTVTNIVPTEITFSGGWINFYVGSGATNNFNPFTSASAAEDVAEASDGLLWLTLAGHNNGYLTNNFGLVAATLRGTGTQIGSGGNDAGNGDAVFDVDFTGNANGNTAGAGAVANVNFDSNTQSDNIGGFGDFTFDSSFGTGVIPFHGQTPLAGSASLRGDVIPAPASIALLGLGLIGLGFFSRRKK